MATAGRRGRGSRRSHRRLRWPGGADPHLPRPDPLLGTGHHPELGPPLVRRQSSPSASPAEPTRTSPRRRGTDLGLPSPGLLSSILSMILGGGVGEYPACVARAVERGTQVRSAAACSV